MHHGISPPFLPNMARNRFEFGGGAYSPASLFTPGTLGVFFDPSDLSTVFQDAAGTTPGAVGSVVGLLLDKSKGLALGAELAVNGDFTDPTGWVLGAGWAISAGRAIKSAGTASGMTRSATLTAGKWYKATFVVSDASAGTCATAFTGGTQVTGNLSGANGPRTEYIQALPGNSAVGVTANAAFNGTIDNLSIVEIQGNHASQATTASKPILRRNATTGALYLEFDGVDDFLSTAAIDFTATDEVTLFAGVRKLSDAATGMVVETGAGTVPASFYMLAPAAAATANYRFLSNGTITGAATATSPASYAAPHSAVLTGQGDISADLSILRVNGTQVATSAADQGTGNYGNLPLYIGRRAGTSLPFNGHLYGLTTVSRLATAAEIASNEMWLNQKTGAY